MAERERIFNVPGSVLALLGIMVAVHLVRATLAPDTDGWLLLALAFIPARLTELAGELPGGEAATLPSFVTHAFVHGNLAHLGFNAVWLLAFGSAIAKRIGGVRFVAFFLMGVVAGALSFLAGNFGLLAPMVGASGGVAALMGATIRLLASARGPSGLWLLRHDPASIALKPLSSALRDRQVVFATAVWIFVNILAVWGLSGDVAPGSIAWESHIGGYLAGLLAIGLFDVQCNKPNYARSTLE